MLANKKHTFIITCPLFYINGNPHIGHLLSIIICDFLKKCLVLSDRNVFLLLGTDEHGNKVFSSIKNEIVNTNISYESTALLRSNKFLNLAYLFNIDYDFFTRTSLNFHKKFVLNTIEICKQLQLINKDLYSGYYCNIEECFFQHQNENKTLTFQTEESCFIKIEENFIKNNAEEFINKNKNLKCIDEIKNYIYNTKKFCISRPSNTHGIQFEFQQNLYSTYVWFDALQGYASILSKFAMFSNITFINVIGRDILRFHCTLWPYLLNILNIESPMLFPHGLVINKGKKISKSFDNFIEFNKYIEHNDESVRLFLLSKNLEEDIEMDDQSIKDFHNYFLINKLGNSISRICKLLSIFNINIFYIDDIQVDSINHVYQAYNDFKIYYRDNLIFKSNNIINNVLKYINTINTLLEETQIWKLKYEQDKYIIDNTLFKSLEIIRICITFLWPIIPKHVERILKHIFNVTYFESKSKLCVCFKKFNNNHYSPFTFLQ